MDQCGAVSALITWQPITAGIVVDCYEVEVECESHSKSPVKGGSGAGKTTRTYIRRQNYALVRGLLPGKGFQVRVRAHNVCGWGPPSPIASFLTNGASVPHLCPPHTILHSMFMLENVQATSRLRLVECVR
jgi:Fibronectin type III domain